MESFSKIVGVLLAVLLLFIVPLMYFAQKQDVISQVYVSNETSKFVDSIKNTGFLSRDMYLQFVRKISATNVSYKIDIVHSHKVVEPIFDDNTSTYLEEYYTYYYNTYEEDILKTLDEVGNYYFTVGDYISVKVVNQTKTFATKIQETIFSTALPKEQILVTYGGVIRSEVD